MIKKILTIVIGIIAIAVGIFVLVNGNRLAKVCTEETVGTIVGILREEETDTDGLTSITYRPQIEFKVGEKLVSLKGNGSSNASDFNVGDTVNILYNPDNIEEHMIKGDNSHNIGGIIWIGIGVVTLLVGVKQFFMD